MGGRETGGIDSSGNEEREHGEERTLYSDPEYLSDGSNYIKFCFELIMLTEPIGSVESTDVCV